MSYGADHLFYLAVDLTFVIIYDRALTLTVLSIISTRNIFLEWICDSDMDLDDMYG
jgi:lysine-specific demethylase 8